MLSTKLVAVKGKCRQIFCITNILRLAILKCIASCYVVLMALSSLCNHCVSSGVGGDYCALCENTAVMIDRVTVSLPSVLQAQRDIIFELRRIAFDAETDGNTIPGSGTEKRKAMYTKDYKMLGFTVRI